MSSSHHRIRSLESLETRQLMAADLGVDLVQIESLAIEEHAPVVAISSAQASELRGKEFTDSNKPMGWDNTTHKKWTDSSRISLSNSSEMGWDNVKHVPWDDHGIKFGESTVEPLSVRVWGDPHVNELTSLDLAFATH